jgi:hypothetical protein
MDSEREAAEPETRLTGTFVKDAGSAQIRLPAADTQTHRDLAQWNDRLSSHFANIRRSRQARVGEFPVVALEHGLSQTELQELSAALRTHVQHAPPATKHQLAWIVYAAEIGYRYSGDEYWQTFERETPGWIIRGDRSWIREGFRSFHAKFGGAVPSGRWAEHFSIISWPIIHAILPLYLQRQFARALYDLRFQLASLSVLDPRTIGRLLAGNAQDASTRFQEFLQQEELAGRIVLAFLGAEPSEGEEPIYPPTLRRIASDLETVSSAREWLKETRRVVADRFKGIGRGAGPATERSPAERPGAPQLGLRPNLLLRHAGGGTWSVLLEVPSFLRVAALNAEIHSFLQRTRCRLNGGSDLKPAGWLLSGNRKGALRSWPDAARPLIQFERSHSTVDHLFESECRLSPGPIWLFRIASDGTAREITGHLVRPGRSYVVITKGTLPQPNLCMSQCKLDCEGVKSFRLSIPPDVSAETTAWLHGLGLQVARTIRVWPAGLPGRGWDGEGSSEWLNTEAPCFGIAQDHSVESYAICLNNGPEDHDWQAGVQSPHIQVNEQLELAHLLHRQVGRLFTF